MKSVVIEIRGNIATLLSDDGCIVNVKNKNYEIGQEVIRIMKTKPKFKVIAAVAAAACFLMMFGIGAAAYYIPTTYVSLDVNPSIEYQVNAFGRVVSATGVNDDGSEIVDEIDMENLKNAPIQEAISLTVDEIAEAGYLVGEGSGIVITTSANDMEKADELADELEDAANDACEENNLQRVATAEAVGKERVAEARELGVTPGKLNLVEKLKETSDDPENFNTEEWLGKSVKDIMAETKQNKEKNKEAEKNAGEDTQNQEQNENTETNGNTDNGTVNGNKPETTNNGNSNNNSNSNSSNTNNGNSSNNGKGNNDSAETTGSDAAETTGTGSTETAGNGSSVTTGSGSSGSAGNGSSGTVGNGSSGSSGNGATETTAPETTTPETTAPETTAPETTVPETTAPETTAP